MLRDFKFMRRNSAKSNAEEAENLPPNPRDSPNPQITMDPSRPPLNTIQEPSRIPKRMSDHDLSGFKPPNKVNRTPTHPKPKYSDSSTPLRTPEKQGAMSKHRFNWAAQKEEEGRLFSNVNTPGSARGGSRECNSTQTTPTKSVSKPPNPGFSFSSVSRPVSNMGARMANYAALSKGIPSSGNLPAVVNTVEVPCFELKEDPSFWMEHNVQVLIRVRPLNNMEKGSFGYSRCLKQDSGQSITWIGQPETRFMYDHVACEAIDQETLFRMVGLPMVENCLSGYNSCMFAYGQTGSGKTHTMLGEIEELEVKPSPNRGMTPRIFEYLFARIRAEEETRRDEHLRYNCKCSFLEIYNEQITDLLDPSSTNLMLREDMKKGVYVENLSEFEVHTVGDILQLLTQGASNRKVAATNMNRESSRSHSVFTCVIESTWEKDSATNFRFARLNLVDLAGSERQKSSGAEGERLKEAANINKSLSTLGHVIMVLVDVANGKPRHIPYRDSRLTFLLQDSLGGNSKTMIIANVSPSICSAAETLNTLKFAQRAKLIQNNAVINEDSSGDVVALKRQIQLLKEELSAIKREKVTRSLSFGGPVINMSFKDEDDDDYSERTPGKENGAVRVSNKQLKSLETTLAGALRRERMAEITVQQLQVEIQQLNRLVNQREEDTRCRKMMLKFREDKIQRMESVIGGMMPMDDYLVRENRALSEENQLLRERVDKNPEVTRFAVENIRLLDQVRKFQDLYEEGEKEILMSEVCELRNQLISSLDGNLKHINNLDTKDSNESSRNGNDLLHDELKITLSELEDCKEKLHCSLEENTKLQREIEELRALLSVPTQGHDCSAEVTKESVVEVPMINVEDIVYLQLELDIVKIILQEQRSSHAETEEMTKSLNRELQLSKEAVISVSNDYERVLEELENAKLVIEALESQQIQTINEIEEKELEISNLKHAESEYSPLERKLSKMHRSLEKAKKLNLFYKSDLASQESNENEADEVRKQVEAETAEVIVCLQEELSGLQQEVCDSKAKEMESRERLVLLEGMREEWDLIASEMECILSSGDESLSDVADQIDVISDSIPSKKSLVSEKVGRMKKYISDKETLIEELSRCLKDALDRRDDMDSMLRSLRGAALVMTEAHQQECCEKDKEIFLLTSELKSKVSTEEELQRLIEHGKKQLKIASSCATAAFVVVNRLWESNCNYRAFVIEGEKNDEILETREKLKELNSGVLAVELSVNDYVKQSGCKSSRTGTRIEEDTADINGKKLVSVRAVNGSDDSMVLLKKEIEFGLKRLQDVKAEMDGLRFEKEEISASQKLGRKSIESTINHAVILGDAINNFKDECELKVDGMEGKIGKLEEMIKESFASWFQEREFLEDELGGAKVMAAQKTIEASCILNKFEEVQDTVKEADIMINELMIANEVLKINSHESKSKESILTSERDVLTEEVKSLKKQYCSDIDLMKRSLSELENVIAEMQTVSVKEWKSVSSDFFSMKSLFHESTESIRTMLEDVWSEIIAKDCKMSVLHLCHMGILLETANGLNAENSLLERGLCESNSVVSELREHNLKSRKELEMCRVLKGKLLADIQRGFSRISSKVDENGEVSLKLASFEKKIQNLQCQEEMMLERSNDMGSELAAIMKELDLCNKYTEASIMDHERLLKEKDDLIQYQEESFMLELLAKDFELLILSSDLRQVALLKEDSEKARLSTYEVFEDLKKDILFKSLEAASCELMLLEKENEYEELLGDFKMKESSLEISSSRISELYQKTRKLQNELEIKNGVFERMSCVETENEELQVQLKNSKDRYSALSQELEDKKASFDIENQELRDSIDRLEEELTLAKVEIENHNVSQCIFNDDINTLQEENTLLRNELRVYEVKQSEFLNLLNLKMLKNANLAESVDKASCKIISLVEDKFVEAEDKFQSIVNEMDNMYKILDQFECVENIALKLDSEAPSLESELSRKDDILKGLLFDLRLLQESASNSKDQKDEMEKVLASLSILERDFELKSLELEKTVAEGQSLEAQLQEKTEKISALELELSRGLEAINSLSGTNAEVMDSAKEALDAKNSMEKEISEARIKIEDLETEVADMEMALCQMSKTTESLKGDLDAVARQRDEMGSKVVVLSKELETVRALAEENEAISTEARERAEIQKVNAEEKEEEVRLLERSIEELEFTINVLEQKVDIVKGEAERQRLQREELELELLGVKEKMQNIKNNDSDLQSFERDHFRKLLFAADEKEKNLKEALQRVQLLETEIAARDAEISQCKDHISELNLYAEAQASEHKQRFKALEAMVEQLKSEVSTTSSPKKLEKLPSKSRGSGSPFKCIGLGLVQQIKSEKVEELTAGRQRIEELEDLATSRQKEILMLKARLASTESMTHDVIRDLLGVKLNMKNYANLMDNQQIHSLMGKAQHHNVDDKAKDQEVANLKLQINEFVKERSGWLEEIERKQAELMSARVALEKLRQQEQLVATENEMLKMENANHKKKVMGLEVEVTKLSGQQNIQQRIHHHAKIKEENNSLRCQNEELRFKLRKTESILSRVKDELAEFRAANGKNRFINFDAEEQLDKKLKETEEEKLQLAQKLVGLCTTVLKAAGISKPTSEISLSVAEEALVQLKNRVGSLEMELEDAKLKNRISDERTRLSEIRPQTSTEPNSRSDIVRSRASQTSFLSPLDR